MSNKLYIRILGEIVEIYDSGSIREHSSTDIIVKVGEKKRFVIGRRNFISHCGNCMRKIGNNTVEISFEATEESEIFSEISPLDQELFEMAQKYGVQRINSALKRNLYGGNLSISSVDSVKKSYDIPAPKPDILTKIFSPSSGNEFAVIRDNGLFFPCETTGGEFPVTYFSSKSGRIYFNSYNDAVLFLKDISRTALLDAKEKEEEERKKALVERKAAARKRNLKRSY